MHNQINDIIRRLFKKDALEEVSDAELTTFIAQYPYVSAGHYLLAQKRYDSDPSAIAAEQQTAALYIHNPLWLPWLLSKNYAGAAALPSADHATPYNGASGAYRPGITEDLVTLSEETAVIGKSANADVEPLSGAPELADAEMALEANADRDSGASGTEDPLEAEISSDARAFKDAENAIEAETSPDTQAIADTAASSETEISSEAQEHAEAEIPSDVQLPAEAEIAPEANADPDPGASGTEDPHQTTPPPDAPETADTEDPLEIDVSPDTRAFKDAENAIEAETSPDARAFADAAAPSETEISSEAQERADGETSSSAPVAAATAAKQDAAALHTEPVSEEYDRPIVFQSYHTIDYFASQGIRLQPSDLSQDKLGQQLKSFTEWLKSMKKLSVVADSAKEAGPEEASLSKRVASIAEHSLEDKEIITEAMAEVWAKQGNVQKATDIYRKLSLQNPHKNAYFAAKIEQLNVS